MLVIVQQAQTNSQVKGIYQEPVQERVEASAPRKVTMYCNAQLQADELALRHLQRLRCSVLMSPQAENQLDMGLDWALKLLNFLSLNRTWFTNPVMWKNIITLNISHEFLNLLYT